MKYILVLSLSVVLFLVFSSALNSKECDCEELRVCNEKNKIAEEKYKAYMAYHEKQMEMSRLSQVANRMMYEKQIDSLKLLNK
jgi:hypothetical protein